MNATDFQRVLSAFADRQADVDFERGKLLVQVREELIEARITSHLGNIQVDETGSVVSAEQWIVERVARLRQLADRILTYLPREEHFVVPSGWHLDQLEHSPDEKPRPVQNVISTLKEILSRPLGGTSSILYLTSDAGEGKTTVINMLALEQAEAYKKGKSHWLVVPISLGGRTFLRLDDVTIGSLTNRFRFPFLFYDAFVELVRLGALVPALDGFEEMFVETASGDAVSALGNLVQSLRSAGSVLIAARKAYFEYQSLQTQSRLYESLRNCSVAFAKLTLDRWNEQHFLQYCRNRGVPSPEDVYRHASSILQRDHPVLTRAVLVRRFVDVLGDAEDTTKVYERLATYREDSPTEFFDEFVNAIVEREVDKWIDKSGTPAKPLLTLEQQHDLLSDLAEEMWMTNTNMLPGDVVDFVSEMFCEQSGFPPVISRQVVERTKQHSLITSAEEQPGRFRFDHEEFYHFYLGRVMARRLSAEDLPGIRSLLRDRVAPPLSLDIAVHHVRGEPGVVGRVVRALVSTCESESQSSCMRENCGAMAVRLVADGLAGKAELDGLVFPADSLRAKRFTNVTFTNASFYPTVLERTELDNCTFEHCEFQRLEVGDNVTVSNTVLRDSTIHCLFVRELERHLYGPEDIEEAVSRCGFTIPAKTKPKPSAKPAHWDDDLTLCERAFRAFLRATEVNDNIFRLRLGSRASDFFDRTLPTLEDAGILKEVTYTGSGRQKRYRLGAQMSAINDAFSRCAGDYKQFLALLTRSGAK